MKRRIRLIDKYCVVCGKQLLYGNTSGYCKEHFNTNCRIYIKTRKECFCIDCGKKLSEQADFYGYIRCSSCAAKERTKISEKNPNYRHGKSLVCHYCKECNKEISYATSEFGYGYCRSCWQLGERNTAFIDGTSKIYPEEFNIELKRKIRKRDNYTCQECDLKEEEHLLRVNFPLSVHHIDYNKQNCEESNLILLCSSCHTKTNFHRDFWENKYKNIMVLRGIK